MKKVATKKVSAGKTKRVNTPKGDNTADLLHFVIANMATKDELKALDAKLDAKIDRVIMNMATKDDIKRLDDRIDALEKRVDKLTRTVEKLASSADELLTEYAAVSVQMRRHDAWFKQIATHIGIELKA